MERLFAIFLLSSLIGSIFGVFLMIIGPVTRKVFSAAWHYYVFLGIIFVMILPIKINLPISYNVFDTHNITSVDIGEAKYTQIDKDDTETSKIQILSPKSEETLKHNINNVFYKGRNIIKNSYHTLSFIWLIVCIYLLITKLLIYASYVYKIRKSSSESNLEEIKAYTNRSVRVRTSSCVSSPILFGVIKPNLILPKGSLSEKQQRNILAHEMMHLKRQDVLSKWILCIAKCVCWYNPFVYIFSKKVNEDLKISCDLAVLKKADKKQTDEYIDVILSLLSNKKGQNFLTTCMTGRKQELKKRFIEIKNKRSYSKKRTAFSFVTFVILVASSFFISGVFTGCGVNTTKGSDDERTLTQEFLPQNEKQFDLDDNITDEKPEESKKGTDADVKEYKTVKADGKSKKNQTGKIADYKKDEVTEPKFYVKNTNTDGDKESGFGKYELKDINQEYIRNELESMGIQKGDDTTVTIGKSYTVKDYNKTKTNVVSDETGSISLYLEANNESLINVNFKDGETGERLEGYMVLANNENMYTFTGFEKDKVYSMEVKSATNDEWQIDGSYIIY